MLSLQIRICLVLGGAIIESITKIHLKGKCGKNFETRNEYLCIEGVIDTKLKEDLNWVWSMRANIHLYNISTREYENHYTRLSLVRCVSALKRLRSCLNKLDS